MKKRLFIMVSILIVSVISGCGNNKDTQVVEIYNKSIIAMEQANSYAFSMNVNQNVQTPLSSQEDSISMNMTMEGKSVENPLSMEMAIRVDMGDAITPELAVLNDNPIQYFVKEGSLYMLNPLLGDVWLVEPIDRLGGLGIDLDPTYLASNFSEVAKEANVMEHGNSFVLSIESMDENMKESFSEMIINIVNNAGIGIHSSETYDVLANTTINNVSLKLWINKETFVQERIDLDLTIEVVEENQTMVVEQKILANFKQFGEFISIEVPKEVEENAVSFDTFLKNSIPVHNQ